MSDPKNAMPATTEIAFVGMATPTAAPINALKRCMNAVAAVMAIRIVTARYRAAKIIAISWLLSPSSATKMMPKLIRKASMRFLRGCGQDESWIAIAEACRHHFTELVRTECDQCIEGDQKYIATTAMSASPMVPLASRRAIAKVTPK